MWGVSTVFLFVAIGLVSATNNTTNPTTNPITKPINVTTAQPTTKPINATTAQPTTKPINATTAQPINSTTAQPINSTTTKPTTTVTPTTTPAPMIAGDYSVKDKAGNYCLLAQMNATFVITYTKTVAINKTKLAQVHVTIPFKGFSTNGSSCNKVNPALNIKWTRYDFTLVFEKRDNTTWQVFSLTLNVDLKDNADFPNATDKAIYIQVTNTTELRGISGGVEEYYACSPDHAYASDTKKATVYLKNVKLQPFVESSKKENFGKEANCVPTTPTPKPDDNNIVPIAVGCALAGLVLIVLIAYIIGRRKSQRGYEKV